MKQQGFFKSIFSVSILTMVSRLLGFVRDQLTAYYLGSSYLSQAFLIGLRIPNTFREMFAEGAFASSFIPSLSKLSNDTERRKRFINDSFSFLFIALIILTIVFMFFMPTVIRLTAPGFINDKFDMTVHLSNIMFPYLMFISITTFFISILQNAKKFFIPAIAPIIFNIVIIISMFAFKNVTENIAIALSYGVFLSGLVQIAFMYYFVKKQGTTVKLKTPKLTPETREFLHKFFPALFGAGIYYLNILVGTIFASLFDGAVSWLYFAQRIYMLPLGIIGAAIATVLLPHLSSNLQTTNSKEKNYLQNNSFLLNLLLGIPCALVMFFLSHDVVSLLFQYGSFNLNDTIQTALILKILSLNVILILFNRIFANLFFARNNTRIPALIALISFATNLICLFIFTKKMGFLGIPHASIISAIIPFLIYVFLIIKNKYTHFKRNVWKNFAIILLANGLLAYIFYMLSNTTMPALFKIGISGMAGLLYLINCGYIIFKGKKIKSSQ